MYGNLCASGGHDVNCVQGQKRPVQGMQAPGHDNLFGGHCLEGMAIKTHAGTTIKIDICLELDMTLIACKSDAIIACILVCEGHCLAWRAWQFVWRALC